MHPSPILSFELFGKNISVYLYGLCIAVGILACLVVFFIYTKHRGMSEKMQDFSFVVAIIAIAVGFLAAKFYQAVYDYIEDPAGGFDFYGAGITAMGGFIGGAAAFIAAYFGLGKLIFKGKEKGLHKKEFNTILNVAPICIVIAHAFGRIGCLMAGCCHGAYLGAEYVFGGMYMRCDGVWGYYVPTQLYEALFLFVLFAVLTVLYYKKNCNITAHIYLIAYGIWRIIIEIFRTDYRGAIVLGLAPSQWQSIIFIAGGAGLLLFYYLVKIPFFLPKKERIEETQIADEKEEKQE